MDPMLEYEVDEMLRAEGYIRLSGGYFNKESGDWFDAPKNDYDLYEIQSIVQPSDEDPNTCTYKNYGSLLNLSQTHSRD